MLYKNNQFAVYNERYVIYNSFIQCAAERGYANVGKLQGKNQKKWKNAEKVHFAYNSWRFFAKPRQKLHVHSGLAGNRIVGAGAKQEKVW